MDRAERIQQRFEVPLVIAALLVVPTLAIQESPLGEPWDSLAYALNWGTWLVFAIAAVTMLAVVPDRWQWIRKHPIDVVVVVLTPPFLPAALQAMRVLRLARLLRLTPLLQYGPRVFSLEGLKYAGLVVVFVIIVGGMGFAQLEDQPSAWDGIWWAFTTMTANSYGDFRPTNDATKVLAMFVTLVGLGFLTMVIGAAGERFIHRSPRDQAVEVVAETEENTDAVLAELRAVNARLAVLESRLLREPSDP